MGGNLAEVGNVELVMVNFPRLPENGNPLSKHVGGGACHELCSMIYILFFIKCVVLVIVLNIGKFTVRIT